MLLKASFFIQMVLWGMLYFAPLSNAVAFVSCYEWQEKAYVSLDCGSEMIKINSVKHGLSQMPRESFCQSPVTDPVTDCFDTYNETEVAMFRGCNVMSSCNISIPFLSLQSKCNVGDGEGSKYVVVDYECVPKTPPTIGMHQYDSSDTNHMSDSTLYLISMNYPSFIQDTNICELTVAENSILKVTVMELHQKKLHDLVCTFELIVSDTQTTYSECTRVIWEASDSPSDLEFVAQQSDLQLQIAMHRKHSQSAGEGKVWLQLKTYDTRNKDELKAGFKSLQCGSHISLWTTTPSESTATTTSKPKTDTSGITIPSTHTTTKPSFVITTESVTNSSTDTGSERESSTGDENVSPRKLKENNIMPVIAGVVAGGLVLIVIVIIIVILMVRKHQKNNKPAKQLDVIDAWDNQSVIDAAKKSAQEFKMEEPYDMSRSLSPTYPTSGQNSFKHHLSYSSPNEYAEVPSFPGSKTPSEIGVSNKGYERDSYYTGDIECEMYSQVNKHDNRSLRKKNGSVIKESPTRVSQLYSKPLKKKKSTPSGFDDPSWTQNGGPNYDFDGQIGENNVNTDEGIYGYTTTLE